MDGQVVDPDRDLNYNATISTGDSHLEMKINKLEPLRGTYRGPVGHGIA